MKLKQIRLDSRLAKTGVLVKYMGTKLLIGSSSTKAFGLAASKLLKDLDIEDFSEFETLEGERKKLLLECIVEHLFLGFEGIEKEDGTPMEPTVANRLMLLEDPELDHLAKFVIQKGFAVGTFVDKRTNELLKN